MRKSLFILVLFILSGSFAFSQNEAVKSGKDYDWGASDDFKCVPGISEGYWHAELEIICTDGKNYMLSIRQPDRIMYHIVNKGDDFYMKLKNGRIITLKMNADHSPLNYTLPCYYSSSVYMPERMFTQVYYDITDIHDIVDNDIVKIRWIMDGEPQDVDYIEHNWVKKFNKRLRAAVTEAREDYEKKAKFKDNNLNDF